MNAMVHRLLTVFALFATLALGGCVTFHTLNQAIPSDDYVTDVTRAYRSTDGGIVVCVRIRPRGDGGEDEAGKIVGVILQAGAATGPGKFRKVRKYRVTKASVEGPCRDPSQDMIPIHIIKVIDKRPCRPCSSPSHDVMPGFSDPAREGPVVYHFTSAYQEDRILYVDPEPIFEGAHAVLLIPKFRTVDNNPYWYPVLPFAVIFDIATIPVYVLMEIPILIHMSAGGGF